MFMLHLTPDQKRKLDELVSALAVTYVTPVEYPCHFDEELLDEDTNDLVEEDDES